MLSGHPHIQNLKIRESYFHGKAMRRLVVDTDLVMPASGRIEENEELLRLHNYLELIAAYDFGDFDEVEIRTKKVTGLTAAPALAVASTAHNAKAGRDGAFRS